MFTACERRSVGVVRRSSLVPRNLGIPLCLLTLLTLLTYFTYLLYLLYLLTLLTLLIYPFGNVFSDQVDSLNN